MAKKTIVNVGRYGVVKDTLDFLLPREAWTDIKNMAPDGDVLASIPSDAVYSLAHNEEPTFLEPIRSPVQSYVFAGCTNTAYAIEDESTLHNITPAGGLASGSSSDYWTGGYGTVPVFNLSGFNYAPMTWDLVTTNDLVTLANWPANTYAKVIGIFNNFIVAGDIEETGTHYPELFWNSDAAAPGAAPSSWDHTDNTKRSRRQDFADGGGAIQQFLVVGNTLFTYKSTTSWQTKIIGGNNVMYHKQFSTNFGAHAPRHAVTFSTGQVFLVGPQGIITHDTAGNNRPVMHKRVQRWIDANIEPTLYNRGFVVHNSNAREVWYFFPTEAGDAKCYIALVWNYRDDTVVFRDVHEAAVASERGCQCAVVTDWTSGNAQPIYSDFAAIDIDDMNFPIGSPAAFPYRSSMLTWGNDKLHVHQSGLEGYSRETSVERTGLILVDDSRGMPVMDSMLVDKHISNVEVHASGVTDDEITINIGWQDEPAGEVVWDEQQKITIGERNDVDFDTNGKIPCIKMSASKAWDLFGYSIDFEITGEHRYQRG